MITPIRFVFFIHITVLLYLQNITLWFYEIPLLGILVSNTQIYREVKLGAFKITLYT